jgi:hypothetical protein
VRVFNRVVEQPVQENVTLREEHVRVDPARRRPPGNRSRPPKWRGHRSDGNV